MKKLQLTLIAILFVIATNAQSNSAYTAAMKKGLSAMESAVSTDQFQESANYFDRIAQAEPKEWLPLYYAGYCDLIVAQRGKQPANLKDELYDKASGLTEKAAQLEPGNSEIEALTGYIIFMKMSVDPTNRAMTMISEANSHLDKAIKLNPENPRPYLIKGQDTFYTPEAFGGGSTNAKPYLLMAGERFAKQNESGIEPAWGKQNCAYLLEKCK